MVRTGERSILWCEVIQSIYNIARRCGTCHGRISFQFLETAAPRRSAQTVGGFPTRRAAVARPERSMINRDVDHLDRQIGKSVQTKRFEINEEMKVRTKYSQFWPKETTAAPQI
jgi:hypothetical protein